MWKCEAPLIDLLNALTCGLSNTAPDDGPCAPFLPSLLADSYPHPLYPPVPVLRVTSFCVQRPPLSISLVPILLIPFYPIPLFLPTVPIPHFVSPVLLAVCISHDPRFGSACSLLPPAFLALTRFRLHPHIHPRALPFCVPSPPFPCVRAVCNDPPFLSLFRLLPTIPPLHSCRLQTYPQPHPVSSHSLFLRPKTVVGFSLLKDPFLFLTPFRVWGLISDLPVLLLFFVVFLLALFYCLLLRWDLH